MRDAPSTVPSTGVPTVVVPTFAVPTFAVPSVDIPTVVVPPVVAVRLLGGLALVCGARRIDIPPGSRRLLAYLAMHPAGADRRQAAGVLWPTVGDGRAAGNLRSALWRLQQVGCPVVRAEQTRLVLHEAVVVDVAALEAWAARVLTGHPTPDDLAVDPGPIGESEMLPGWYDDWVLAVRDRLRLRTLHALEALSRLLREVGRIVEAVEAVQVAVLAEPLRESGQRALIEAHQAAGDWVSARRQYDTFRGLLRREIGVEPSEELTAVATAPRRPLGPRVPAELAPRRVR